MNIQIRVAAAQALKQIQQMQQQLAATRQQVAALQKQQAGGASAAAASGIGSPKSTQNLAKWGNQLQWTGRQIEYNFTVPILAAAGAATKFQLDNEKAFTYVSRVYGDTQAAAAQFMKEQKGLTESMANQKATQIFTNELNALGDAFEALSNHYGVQQKQVLEVAGAWAQAGASGLDLAKSTQISLQTAILGSMDAVKATEALIAIQGQYTMSTDQLSETIATLNAVENQTGIDMQGLIDGFSRSAGVAREAGVDIRHLAAFLAAMTPAAGSASQAGNALKTIISRLMSPTKESAQVMNAMGLNIKSMAWQGANATERLLIMSKAFAGLSDSQKQVASSVIASRWQINKFDVLMRELNSTTGFYQKALDATIDRSKVFAQMQKELNTVLSSSPQRLQQIWVIMQNALADVIQPLIPYLLYLAGLIGKMVTAFSNLNPHLQKFVILAALMIAVVGPLIRYIGSTASLIYELGKGFAWLLKPFGNVIGLFKIFGKGVGAVGSGIGMLTGLLGSSIGTIGAWVKAIFMMQTPLIMIFGTLMTQLLRVASTGWVSIGKVFATPWRLILGQALLNAGALVGIFQSMMRRIIATILGSGIVDAISGVILSIMRLGTATGPLTGIWMRAGLLWERIWGAMYTAFMLTFGVLPRIAAAASAGIQAVWSILGARLVVIQAGFQTRLVAMWALMGSKLGALFRSLGTLLTGLWMAMATRLVAITSTMWLAMMEAPAKFLVFMKGLPARLATVGAGMVRGLVAALPAILTALRTLAPMILRFLTGPWGIAIGAVIGIVYHFRDALIQIYHNIVGYFANTSNGLVKGIIGAWNLLPQGVQNALVAVVKVVRAAALQVYEWFSYLNPFAHHSPSLVENVTAGMAAVKGQFASVGSIGNSLKGAYRDIAAFGNAVRNITGAVGSLQHADDRAKIAKWAPGALAAFDQLDRRLTTLTANMNQLKSAVDAQQAVVDAWEAKLKAANDALDKQNDKLDKLKDTASKYSDQLDAARQRLSDFASAPIKGMQAMDDAIFNNQMAQKKLQLEMMKMEDAVGPLDDIKSKMDAINGAQELLRGKQADLRSAGAGSEILKVYDQEIGKLDQQKTAYQASADKLQKLQDQLDKLGRTADRLDLEKSLKFDPLTHAIERAANTMKELPFDEIMSGITQSKADIDKYTAAFDKANAAVAQQQKNVEAATKARDAIQARYDAEQNKLDALKKSYDAVAQAVRDVESALNDATSAADTLSQRKAPKGPKEVVTQGLENFREAAGGNFADVGGKGVQLRKDWNDQSDQIKQFTADLSKQTAGMFADLNPFAPLKGKFTEFKNWLVKVWDSVWGGIRDFASHIFDNVNIGGATSSIGKKISGFVNWLKGVWGGLVDGLKAIWRLLGPDIIKIFQNLWKGVMDVWKQVAPELEKFGQLFGPIGKAIQNVWTMAKPVLALLGGAVLFLVKLALSIIANVIGPVFHAIGTILTGIIRIIRGAVQIIVGIFTLDFGLMMKGVGNIFSGLFKVIWGILRGAVQIIWGIIKGLVLGIWNFFKWLYDELVGHSIVPDIVNGVIAVFKWLVSIPKWIWDNVLAPIYGFFKNLWDKYLNPFVAAIVKGVITSIQGWKIIGKWVWDNVLSPLYGFFKSIWTSYLSPWITNMVKGAIIIWQGLKAVVLWIWNNVLVPIYNLFKSIWTNYISPAITNIWKGITSGWQKIQSLIKWTQDKFITPLQTAFGKLVEAIGKIFDKVQEKISGPITKIKGWINSNLIDPLNKVVKLFGLTIPKFDVGGAVSTAGHGSNSAGRLATGGRVPGFSSSSTADNIPAWLTANEYVQPVSTVRHYGVGVMEALRRKQIPKEAFSNRGYFLGGLIDKGMKKVQSWMEKGPEYAINQIMNPAKNLISRVFPIPEFANKTAVGTVGYAQKTMLDWIHKAGSVGAGGLPSNPGLAGAAAWARTQVGKPYLWGGVGPDGYDCSGFMSAITNYIQGRPLFQRRFATGSLPGGIFQPGPGAFSIAWFRGNPGHTAGTLNGMNVESRGGKGVVVGSSARGATDKLFNSGIYHLPGYAVGGKVGDPPFDLISPLGKYYNRAFPPIDPRGNGLPRLFGAANGALVTGGQGGTAVMVGEGSRDELIQPLPADWRNGRGDSGAGVTINVNGNLEFPNITSGDDVEELVDGLKALAGDYA